MYIINDTKRGSYKLILKKNEKSIKKIWWIEKVAISLHQKVKQITNTKTQSKMKITDFIEDINATYPVITQTDGHTYSELKGYELEELDGLTCSEVDFSMVDGVVRDIIEDNFFNPEAITKIIVVADVEKTTVYYIGVYAE